MSQSRTTRSYQIWHCALLRVAASQSIPKIMQWLDFGDAQCMGLPGEIAWKVSISSDYTCKVADKNQRNDNFPGYPLFNFFPGHNLNSKHNFVLSPKALNCLVLGYLKDHFLSYKLVQLLRSESCIPRLHVWRFSHTVGLLLPLLKFRG